VLVEQPVDPGLVDPAHHGADLTFGAAEMSMALIVVAVLPRRLSAGTQVAAGSARALLCALPNRTPRFSLPSAVSTATAISTGTTVTASANG